MIHPKKGNSKKAQLERLQRVLPQFVAEVEKEALRLGTAIDKFADEKLLLSQEQWRKIRTDNYPHPGFLIKTRDVVAERNPELCRVLRLPELVDYVLRRGKVHPYAGQRGGGTREEREPQYVIPFPPVPEFVGRKKILDTLTRFLFDDVHTVFYLHGVQGIGKSEVVRYLFRDLSKKGELRIRFPDGATLANMHAPGENRRDLGRTMTIVLQNLFLYQPPQGDPEVISTDFHRQLCGKRVLLAVDNVHGQTEVERLSSWAVGGVSKVILLGLSAIDARPDWLTDELGPFEDDEVRDYLNKYYSKVAKKVLNDARLHSNRPKYVWKCARYHANPTAHRCKDSREYFRCLQENPDERRHLALLRREEQEALCMLTVCTGTFDGSAASAVLKKSEGDAVPFLVRLAEMSWLCRDSAGMFSFHSVERDQLQAERSQSLKHAAYLRYGSFLSKKLSELEVVFLRGGEHSRAAVQEFNRYRNDLFETFEYLAEVGQMEKDAAEVAKTLICQSPNILFIAFPYSRHKTWAEAIQQVIGYDGDSRCQYYAKWFLDLYAYLDNRFDEAKRLASERVRIARELKHDVLLVEALLDLGHAETRLVAAKRSGISPVDKHFAEAHRIARRLKDQPRCLCHSSFHLGWAHMYAAEHVKASRYFERALQLACETGDAYAKGRILINVSRNLRRKGRLDEALLTAQTAHEFAQRMGSNVLEALSHRNLALVFEAKGDEHLARQHGDRWRRWKKSTGHPHAERTQIP